MVDRPDAARLVRAAEHAMPIEISNPRDARLITAAVLRSLAGELGPNDRPEHGCYWSPSALRDLAEQVDKAGACCDLHEPGGCCEPFDCGPCCANCPTCPNNRRETSGNVAPSAVVSAYFDGFEFPAEHCPRRRQAPRAEDALLAVLRGHPRGDDGECRGCGVDAFEDPISWPCHTVQAIVTELTK